LSSADTATTTVNVSDLPGIAGRDLGNSRWQDVTQQDIDTFAKLTGDEQWIHVDVERARSTPIGSTIAHGFFILSRSSKLLFELIDVEGATQILNYGLNRVRFTAMTSVNSRVRMNAKVNSVEEVKGGYQVTFGLTFEREGHEKPVCVAELLFRYYGPSAS